MPRLLSVRLSLVGGLACALAMTGAPSATALPPPGSGPSGASATADLDRRITRLLPARLADPRLGRDVAIQVRSSTGRVLFSSQAGEGQMPASNMKLVTALGALTSISPGTRFPTRVTRRASGSGLVLVGGGDPMLTAADLDVLAARTVNSLSAQPGGAPNSVKLFVDDRLFNDRSLAPGWRSTYVPGEVSYVRALGRRGVRVTDTTVEAANVFASRLRARGVAVALKGRGAGPLGPKVARIDGNSIEDAVHVMLRDSDNQVAEVLFRQVAIARGKAPTWTGGRVAAREVLQENGIKRRGVVLRDGSGLSRSDRLTARAAAQLLSLVQEPSPRLSRFVSWLPVAGRTGTLGPYASRYVTAPSRCAAGRVHAKTGTLTGALALSGVAVGEDGRQRVFSIIVNHPPTGRYSVLTVRRAMDGLAATVTGCW